MKFILVPLFAWCIAGFIKVLLYGLRHGRLKPMEFFRYGGFPSAHTALVTAPVFFAGLTQGFFTPVFSIGFSLVLIVITDAHGLRRYVGQQAQLINQLQTKQDDATSRPLKEHVGHSWLEIFGGIFTGIAVASIGYFITN